MKKLLFFLSPAPVSIRKMKKRMAYLKNQIEINKAIINMPPMVSIKNNVCPTK